MVDDISSLRQSVRSAPYFGDRVGSYWLLVDHPDVTWRDLVDGLEAYHHELIREYARGSLYAALRPGASKDDVPIDAPLVWREMLLARGWSLDAKVRQRPRPASPRGRDGSER